VTGSWFDVDYFTFVKGKDATDPEPITKDQPVDPSTTSIVQNLEYDPNSRQDYFVFDVHGVNMGILSAYGFNEAAQILKNTSDIKASGVYFLRNRRTGKMRSVRVTK